MRNTINENLNHKASFQLKLNPMYHMNQFIPLSMAIMLISEFYHLLCLWSSNAFLSTLRAAEFMSQEPGHISCRFFEVYNNCLGNYGLSDSKWG